MNANLSAAARAHSNIALIKYWGKRDHRLNLPAVGSLSLTLDDLYTETEVSFDPALSSDELGLDGGDISPAPARFTRFLDLIRHRAHVDTRARIISRNNFPTAAGLASSASGFAALALAASHAAGLTLEPRALSVLARQGSGSAARSIFGGLAFMHRGQQTEGEDAYAEPLDAGGLSLRMAIGIVDASAKKTGSTRGMEDSAATAPYYPAWISGAETDLQAARQAISAGDFTRLGELTEHSCLKMHGLMLATRPGLLYWRGPTVEAIHAVRALRDSGTEAYFTIDAGPQIKVLFRAGDEAAVTDCLKAQPGVASVRLAGPGPDAHLRS